MRLRRSQLETLIKSIDFYHTYFIGVNIGKEVLSKNDLELLFSFGIDEDDLKGLGMIDYQFQLGLLVDAAKNRSDIDSLSFSDFKSFLESGGFVPLGEIELKALEFVKNQSYKDIKNLSRKISNNLETWNLEADKTVEWYENNIRQGTEEMLLKRGTASELASFLKDKTKDFSRDLDRVADFISHQAYDMGKATAYLKKYGKNSKVYKIVFDKACKHCVRLYLTSGANSKPKVFKLSDILSNGTNIGLKVDDWKPVVGPTHPWCRCELNKVPKGFRWDDKTGDFTKPISVSGNVKKRKSSVRISIGDKSYEQFLKENSE